MICPPMAAIASSSTINELTITGYLNQGSCHTLEDFASLLPCSITNSKSRFVPAVASLILVKASATAVSNVSNLRSMFACFSTHSLVNPSCLSSQTWSLTPPVVISIPPECYLTPLSVMKNE